MKRLLLLSAFGLFLFLTQPERNLALADPVTLGLLVGGSVIAGGFAAKQQADSAAAISEFNAKVSEREAIATKEASSVEAGQFQEAGEALQGEQTTAFAKSGVLGTTGSPVTVKAKTARDLELDRQMILAGGEAKAQRLRGRARGQRFQAESFKKQGRGALLGSVLGGVGQGAFTTKSLS